MQRPLAEDFVTNALSARLAAGKVGAQRGGLPRVSPLNMKTKTTGSADPEKPKHNTSFYI